MISQGISEQERRTLEIAEKMPREERQFRDMVSSAYRAAQPLLDDLNRRLLIDVTYGTYGRISSILITIEGSPPKGRLLVLYDTDDRPTCAYFFKQGKARLFVDFRIMAQNLYDRKTKRYEKMAIIENFLKFKKIPNFKE